MNLHHSSSCFQAIELLTLGSIDRHLTRPCMCIGDKTALYVCGRDREERHKQTSEITSLIILTPLSQAIMFYAFEFDLSILYSSDSLVNY